MSRFVFGLVSAAGLLFSVAQAEALPMVATYTGVVFGTATPFTAAFHYDTADLIQSPNPDYLDAKSGTLQWATYTSGTSPVTFTNATAFSKGEYLSFEYDQDGNVTAFNTVHEYSLSADAGMLSLAFGGANDMGLVTFADGSYSNLDPQSFLLAKDGVSTVSPVPLPAPLALFAGGLILLGLAGRSRTRNA